jgi:HlyD family secretion protein
MRNLILGQPVDVYTASVGQLLQTVVASGRVMSPRRVEIAAETTGRVLRIPVVEGQAVKRGQLLIALDAADDHAGVAQAGAAVEQAEARLRQLREVGLPGAKQGLLQAEANAEQLRKQQSRMRELQARGFVGQAQLDDANRNFEVAASQVNAARVQVRTNTPAGSDSAMALAALAQARANLLLANVKLEQNAILAPVDGILIARSVEQGDIVQPGKQLMVLAPQGETQVVVQVDEKNFAKLALGQHALGSADAFASQRFDARVAYINPGIDATRGSVEVKLLVANPPSYLRQDMTVSVDIETARRDNALVVATGAVRDTSSPTPWVMVVRGGRTARQVVTIGLRGDSRSEVLGGISPGDVVVPATAAAIAVGQRVRPHPVVAAP